MQQPTIASWLITTAHKLHTLFVDCSAASRWSQYPRMYCSQSRSRYLELSAPQFQQVQGGARHELNRLIILLCRTFMKAIRRCQQSGSFGALAAHVGHVGLSLSLSFSLYIAISFLSIHRSRFSVSCSRDCLDTASSTSVSRGPSEATAPA